MEQYIERCLNSIINQTLKEIEIIVIDDGSKDNSKNIISDMCKKITEYILFLEKIRE